MKRRIDRYTGEGETVWDKRRWKLGDLEIYRDDIRGHIICAQIGVTDSGCPICTFPSLEEFINNKYGKWNPFGRALELLLKFKSLFHGKIYRSLEQLRWMKEQEEKSLTNYLSPKERKRLEIAIARNEIV